MLTSNTRVRKKRDLCDFDRGVVAGAGLSVSETAGLTVLTGEVRGHESRYPFFTTVVN